MVSWENKLSKGFYFSLLAGHSKKKVLKRRKSFTSSEGPVPFPITSAWEGMRLIITFQEELVLGMVKG